MSQLVKVQLILFYLYIVSYLEFSHEINNSHFNVGLCITVYYIYC